MLLRRTRVATASAAFLFTLAFSLAQIGPSAIGSSEPARQAFSDTTRNLGLSALLLLTASAPLGLLVGRRLVRGRRAAALYAAHRTHSVCGLAVAGLHLLVLLGPSFYLRSRLGARRWRIAHRLVGIGLALALVHSLGGG